MLNMIRETIWQCPTQRSDPNLKNTHSAPKNSIKLISDTEGTRKYEASDGCTKTIIADKNEGI